MRRIDDIEAAAAAGGGQGLPAGLVDAAGRARSHERAHERARWLVDHIMPHEPWLRRWLQRHGAAADEEDIVQESYLLLMQAGSLDHVRNPRNYLCQTARSVIMRRVRRDAIARFENRFDLDDAFAADLPLQDDVIAYRDDLVRLNACVERLPPRTRAVFSMRRLEGLSLREAARRLAISESAVEKHLRRAMVALRGSMGWH